MRLAYVHSQASIERGLCATRICVPAMHLRVSACQLRTYAAMLVLTEGYGATSGEEVQSAVEAFAMRLAGL